jgi:hypothetical protein
MLLCWILFAEIAAVALFVLGPQAGSLDDDEDGTPDVPMVVADSALSEDVSRAVGGNLNSDIVIDLPLPPFRLAEMSNRPSLVDSPLPALSGGRVFLSCCSLRC